MLICNIFVFIVTVHYASSSSFIPEKHKLPALAFLDESNFADFTRFPSIRGVVFYEPFPEHHDIPEGGEFENVNHARFLPLLQSSAEYLSSFEIYVGLVDCTKTPNLAKCGDPDNNNVYLFGYRNSKQKMKLAYENLFDENGMIGSFLHLNAMKSLPIINKEEKMEEKVLLPSRGKKDVLVGYFQYLGDPEHRAFVEAAYPYLNDFSFVIFTDREDIEKCSFYKPLKKEEKSAVYLFRCKNAKEGEACPLSYYKGYYGIDDFANFMKNLKTNDKVLDVPSESKIDVFKDVQISVGYLFYNAESKKMVLEAGNHLQATYPGEFGVLAIDTERVDVKKELNQDITKVPAFSLKLFHKKKPDYMTHRFSKETVVQFISKVIVHFSYNRTDLNAAQEDDALTLDDEVAGPVYNLGLLPKTQIDTSKLTTVTEKTFPEVTTRDVPTLVLFYTTYDPASMAVLRSFSEAAMKETHVTSLTTVDCFNWNVVCEKEKVHNFPQIRFYQSGRKPIVYKGILDGEAAINYLKVLRLGTPEEITCTDRAKSFMAGMYPENIYDHKLDATVAVGLTSKEDIPVIKEFADSFGSEMFFAYGTDQVAEIMCPGGAPCAAVMVPNEPKKVLKLREGSIAASTPSMYTFINAHRLPALTELTVTSFPKVYKQKKPLVLLFIESGDNVIKALATVAASGDFRGHAFTWVNCDAVDSIGSSILHTYSEGATFPALALVNIDKGQVHLFDKNEFTSDNMKDWIMRVGSGKESPSYVMPNTEWKPLHEGYDFTNKTHSDGEGDRLRGAKSADVPKMEGEKAEPMDKMADKAGESTMPKKVMDMGMKKSAAHEEL